MPIGAADGVMVPSPAMPQAGRVLIDPGGTAPLVAGSDASGLFMVRFSRFSKFLEREPDRAAQLAARHRGSVPSVE